MVERTVAVALVSIPLISVEGLAVDSGIVHAAKDDLVADDSPGCAPLMRVGETSIEPVLLSAAHERSTRIIDELLNVVVVPIQSGDAAVVIASVKHDEIEQLSHLEAAPDAQVVIEINLADTA